MDLETIQTATATHTRYPSSPSHFTRKNARFRAPASSPITLMQLLQCVLQHHVHIHAAITMRFASPRCRTPRENRLTLKRSRHFPSSPLPFVTTSLSHRFPSSPLPFVTTSLRHHFPSSPLPFVTTSLRHHFPSSPLPLVTASLSHHFPQSPSFVSTLRHHPSSSPFVLNSLGHHPSFLLCDVLLCDVKSHTTLR